MSELAGSLPARGRRRGQTLRARDPGCGGRVIPSPRRPPGRDALNQVSAAELVLLDVNLPDMSGFEVCRLIKSDPRTAAIPVIQVSATATDVADRAHGLTPGGRRLPGGAHRARGAAGDGDGGASLLSAPGSAPERTAAMLAELVSVTLGINAAETFDGLAAAAATGAARIFATHAVMTLEMPDGQTRRTSASPGIPGVVRRGGPPGLAGQVADRVLSPRQATGIEVVRAGRLARHHARQHACARMSALAVARTKPGRPPRGHHDRPLGDRRRRGHADPAPASAVGRAWHRGRCAPPPRSTWWR